MKLKTVHFTKQIPVCGAYAPMNITVGATTHREYVSAMELDEKLRGIWLALDGQKAPEKGRHFVPMEHVLKFYPLEPVPVAAPAKK